MSEVWARVLKVKLMNKQQLQQLKHIDEEFERRGMNVGTISTLAQPPYESITISTDRNIVNGDWMSEIHTARHDARRFGIKQSAQYMLEMLRRKGIYGIAIYSNRDEFDAQFGSFVSRARLLKYIKKIEAKR